MILADKIMDERKKNGWSQEELADKLGVSRQSVSKWESAQSVPDLQRILEMSRLFGVSTDYLLKDEEGTPPTVESAEPCERLRRVSLEEAHEFLAAREPFSKRMAFGVGCFVLSPVPLLLLLALRAGGALALGENTLTAIGVVALFVLVIVGLVFVIPTAMRNARWDWLSEKSFDTEYGVDGMVRSRLERFGKTYVTGITCGVVMILCGVIAVVVGGLVKTGNDGLAIGMVSVLLVLVAVSAGLFVRLGLVRGGYSILLQEGGYSKAEKEDTLMQAIGSVYWLSVTAGYLLWSFLTDNWGFTWIVWPIAALVFGLISAVVRAVRGK